MRLDHALEKQHGIEAALHFSLNWRLEMHVRFMKM